jgi:macrolide transport system ATP-binding/permease protein
VSLVSARNLSKAYGPQTLFAQIAVTIRPGERVGLLDANGAGKSTLLGVLTRAEPPQPCCLSQVPLSWLIA